MKLSLSKIGNYLAQSFAARPLIAWRQKSNIQSGTVSDNSGFINGRADVKTPRMTCRKRAMFYKCKHPCFA
jgi:hypothetical protein